MPVVFLFTLMLTGPGSAHAADITTAGQASAVFDTIRTTPGQFKLHCEQLKLQGDAIDAQMRRDTAGASAAGRRINAIQIELVGYRQAFAFYSSKAGDRAFYKTPEGKALDKAQKALDAGCPKPKIKR